MPQRFKLKYSILFRLAIAPACFLAWMVWTHSVDVPYWDQWDYVHLFVKLDKGTLRFADLFAQIEEYRQFFPNLLFVALGWLTSWNVRYEMLISFLLACLISFNVYRLSKATINDSNAALCLLLFLAANSLIFSPVQYLNWLNGIQIIYFVPVACITACLAIAYTNLKPTTKFALCMCLATVSTFSSANGLLCWIVVLPVLVFSRKCMNLRKRRLLILAWIIGFGVNLTFYFYGYRKPPHNPSLLESFFHPVKALIYFAGLLGAPIGTGRGRIAVPVGAILLLLFALVCSHTIKRASDSVFLGRTIGWLMLGAYSMVSAALITAGRSGFGVEHSLTPRYTTFTIYLAVSLIYLIPISLESFKQSGNAVERNIFFMRTAAVIAVIISVALHLFTVSKATQWMSSQRENILRGKACLLFINFKVEEKCSAFIYPDQIILRERANELNRLGYLRPRLIESDRIQSINEMPTSSEGEYGAFETLGRSENLYTARGWSLLPERREAADAVVLTYTMQDKVDVIFKVFGARDIESNNCAWRQTTDLSGKRWRITFYANELPQEEMELKAWAFDATTGRAFLLAGTHRIEAK